MLQNILRLKNIKKLCFKRFLMKDLGSIGTYLRINIFHDHEVRKMTRDQNILSLSKRYNVIESKFYSTLKFEIGACTFSMRGY